MKQLLAFTSILESLLGIALIFIPSIVLNILLGIEVTKEIETISRLTGIVYFCFGLACYPYGEIPVNFIKSPAFKAMFMYNLLAALYLGYLKFAAGIDGKLLLPAFALHTLITFVFAYMIFKRKKK